MVIALKILQVCPFNYGEVGGVSMHVKSISERLAKRHNVTVYATNPNMKYPRHEVINGVKVERFKCYSPSDSYFLSWEMLLRLRKVKFDVIHGHFYHAFPLHLSALGKYKKFIATPHFHGSGHTLFRDCFIRLLKPFGERTFKKAHRIVCVSEHEMKSILRQFKVDYNKIVLIPNGVDLGSFSNIQRQNHGFKSVIYVGCLRVYKGVHYLVEVLPKLEKNVVLEIVGDGPLKPYLEKRAKELNIYERVKFYKNLERLELLQKYIDADVLVLLSTHEAYSLVVAEALTAGTPCIVANASALSEWIDEETCFGIDFPISINALAKLIRKVISIGKIKQKTGKWLYTKILDWDEVVQRLEKLYFD
jgi:glycosyltransferase involved in cell wall biosynthesis